jgi:hypothetical protein
MKSKDRDTSASTNADSSGAAPDTRQRPSSDVVTKTAEHTTIPAKPKRGGASGAPNQKDSKHGGS